MVNVCPLTKFGGRMQSLHEADDDAIHWHSPNENEKLHSTTSVVSSQLLALSVTLWNDCRLPSIFLDKCQLCGTWPAAGNIHSQLIWQRPITVDSQHMDLICLEMIQPDHE